MSSNDLTRSAVQAPVWMGPLLILAAAFHVIVGVLGIIYPAQAFKSAGMASPLYPQLVQTVASTYIIFGIGFAIAAFSPVLRWPLILVGLLAKLPAPLGLFLGDLPLSSWWSILVLDLVWWLPFGLILGRAYSSRNDAILDQEGLNSAMRNAQTHQGQSLYDLVTGHQVELIFLRHFGCTFCRQTLSELAEKRAQIESVGTRIVLVHMSEDEDRAQEILTRYGLEDVDRISDPDRTLYQVFGLKNGNLWQLLGPRVWWRGFRAAILEGHGWGFAKESALQMPGAFSVKDGRVVRAFRHNDASDRPDYTDLALCQASNRVMKENLEMAARIQQSLLPGRLPKVEGVSFGWALEPSDELAGDTLNIIPLDEHHVALYVLDVSGHGVASALLSVALHHWLSPGRSELGMLTRTASDGSGTEPVPPAEIAERLNQQFPLNHETGQYFTMVYGVLDTRTYVFTYVTAGHPAPICHRKNGAPAQLSGTGFPVGLVPEPNYVEHTIQLSPGDALYMYSDGLTELPDLDEDVVMDQLMSDLSAAKPTPLKGRLSAVVTRAKSAARQTPYEDDISILGFEVADSHPDDPSSADDTKTVDHTVVS